jgi:hypothetical protein
MNAVIQALDGQCKPIGEPKDLTTVAGMAWGVREDIQNGKRGMIPNWCSSPAVWWLVTEA